MELEGIPDCVDASSCLQTLRNKSSRFRRNSANGRLRTMPPQFSRHAYNPMHKLEKRAARTETSTEVSRLLPPPPA